MHRKYAFPIISGLLLGTSHIPFPPWALFFSLVPLFVFWKKSTESSEKPRHLFFAGWVTQFVGTLIGFHWIAYTAYEFGHFPMLVSGIILIGFCAIAHLHYAFAGLLYSLAQRYRPIRHPLAQFASMGLFLALAEQFYPMVFPWHLGYPWLWARLPATQLTDIIGFEGLNHITIGINCLIAYGWSEFRRQNSKRPLYQTVGAALGFLLVINIAGLFYGHEWKNTDAEFKFLAIQGNIGNEAKYYAEYRENFRSQIIEQFTRLSREGLKQFPDSDILVWPETAYPSMLDVHFNYLYESQLLRAKFQELQRPLITGGFSRDPGSRVTYNGLFLLDSNGNQIGKPYRKTILILFGEKFPLSDKIPYMKWLFPDIVPQQPGSGPHLLEYKGLKVGPQICYESLYPWLAGAMTDIGAQVFVNVTNDSWYDSRFEPNQHLYVTLARALEFRRPLVRVTNTGITTSILASGEILAKTAIGQEAVQQFKVAYKTNPSLTVYSQIVGSAPYYLAIGVLLLLSLAGGKRTQES